MATNTTWINFNKTFLAGNTKEQWMRKGGVQLIYGTSTSGFVPRDEDGLNFLKVKLQIELLEREQMVKDWEVELRGLIVELNKPKEQKPIIGHAAKFINNHNEASNEASNTQEEGEGTNPQSITDDRAGKIITPKELEDFQIFGG